MRKEGRTEETELQSKTDTAVMRNIDLNINQYKTRIGLIINTENSPKFINSSKKYELTEIEALFCLNFGLI